MSQAERLIKKLPAYRDWLSRNGAQVLEPTNEWEVVRFKSGDETCITYRNRTGGIKHSGLTAEFALKSFLHAKSWRAATPTCRRKSMSPMVATLRKRDGGLCFFCQRQVDEGSESVEHLVNITHGGPNHISNLFLAHVSCNQKAGHLSAMEKICIHVAAINKKEAKQMKMNKNIFKFSALLAVLMLIFTCISFFSLNEMIL